MDGYWTEVEELAGVVLSTRGGVAVTGGAGRVPLVVVPRAAVGVGATTSAPDVVAVVELATTAVTDEWPIAAPAP